MIGILEVVQQISLVCYAEILIYGNWELKSSTPLPKTQQSVCLMQGEVS